MKNKRPIDQLVLRHGPLGAALLRLPPDYTLRHLAALAREHGGRIVWRVEGPEGPVDAVELISVGTADEEEA